MTPPTCSHPSCYARALGDCCGPVNREHYVSESLLGAIWSGKRAGSVHGLAFLNCDWDTPTRFGIKSLTAKILCEGHNRALSPFDAEMTKFFQAKARLLCAEHVGEPIATNVYVGGDHIERWMLKTLCGGVVSKNFSAPLADVFAELGISARTLDILFRDAEFKEGNGLYVSHPPTQFDHFVFRVEVVGCQRGLAGMRMWVFGSLYSLVLIPDQNLFPELVDATYRPTRIVGAKARNSILLRWSGVSSGKELRFNYRANREAE